VVATELPLHGYLYSTISIDILDIHAIMTSELEDGAMKMSTRGRYGLRVMMELALHHGKGPVPVETIANNQEISGKYIHNLMSSLHSAGLARTVRGPKGGYELARPPSEITALDAVEALEGKNVLMECVADASSCRRAGRCAQAAAISSSPM